MMMEVVQEEVVEDTTTKMEMIEEEVAVEAVEDMEIEETVETEMTEMEEVVVEEEMTVMLEVAVAEVVLVGTSMATTNSQLSKTNSENHQNKLHNMVVQPTEDLLLILKINSQLPQPQTTKEVDKPHLDITTLEIEKWNNPSHLLLQMVQLFI